MTTKKKRTLALFLLFGSISILLIAIVVFVLSAQHQIFISESKRFSSTEAVSTDLILSTMAPPLQNVEFPEQIVEYPPEWPVELRYPEQFSPVELSSGTLPDGEKTGWVAKLRYQGDRKLAINLAMSFLAANGWQVVEYTDLDSGGILVLMERDPRGTGIVIVDEEVGTLGIAKIIAAIFP